MKFPPLEKEIRWFERWKYTMIARVKNAKAAVERTRLWRSNNIVGRMLIRARVRSRTQNVAYNITPEDIHIPALCPVLGIPLFVGKGRMCDNSPSLDKLNPALGYVKGNILVMSQKANFLKNNATPDELLKLAHWIIKTYAQTLPAKNS